MALWTKNAVCFEEKSTTIETKENKAKRENKTTWKGDEKMR